MSLTWLVEVACLSHEFDRTLSLVSPSPRPLGRTSLFWFFSLRSCSSFLGAWSGNILTPTNMGDRGNGLPSLYSASSLPQSLAQEISLSIDINESSSNPWNPHLLTSVSVTSLTNFPSAHFRASLTTPINFPMGNVYLLSVSSSFCSAMTSQTYQHQYSIMVLLHPKKYTNLVFLPFLLSVLL